MSNEHADKPKQTQDKPTTLAAAEKFINQMGGIEKAKQAVEALRQLRKSA